MRNIYKDKLEIAISQLKLSVDNFQLEQLLSYHKLLIKWNKAYNLTAIRDPLEMISRHLVDSLSLASSIEGQRFIDVGTGAGLPGVVLAILFPDREWDLLDSNGKKTRFLFQVKIELGLENLTIHHCRVEQFKPEVRYDGVLSRAFATLVDMVDGSKQLLTKKGRFYAMKGVYPHKELSELEKAYKVETCHSLLVPGDSSQRHLVVISKRD